MRVWLAIGAALALAACKATPPPPNLAFDGLPVTGNRAHAESLGFGGCKETSDALRCRRSGVMLMGQGPFEGAVDLRNRDDRVGFRQLTLWHDSDQRAVLGVGKRLAAQGWRLCRTGQEDRGDQEIWTKPGASVRFSVDISFWGKRRLRILPETGDPLGHCWN